MRDMVEPDRSQFSLSCICSQSVVHHSIAWNSKGDIRHVSRLHVFGRLFQSRPDNFLVSDRSRCHPGAREGAELFF